MQGETEQHQISLISQLCGSITPDVWPNVDKLDLFTKLELPQNQNRKIRERLRHYIEDSFAVDLVDKLLVLDPKKRLDADSALSHDIFFEAPMPSKSDLAHKLSRYRSSMFVMHSNPGRHIGGGAGPSGARGVGQGAAGGHMHERVF